MDLDWEDFLPLFIPHTIKVGEMTRSGMWQSGVGTKFSS